MKNLTMIACVGKNRELGRKNDLVFKFKEDLQFFRDTTLGHYVVMGKRTYESLPVTLKNRKYLIISDVPISPTQPDAKVFNSLDDFLSFAKELNNTIFVIGGGMIYKALLPYADNMILTEVNASVSDADVFFPEINKKEWKVKRIGKFNSEQGIKYCRRIYTRK